MSAHREESGAHPTSTPRKHPSLIILHPPPRSVSLWLSVLRLSLCLLASGSGSTFTRSVEHPHCGSNSVLGLSSSACPFLFSLWCLSLLFSSFKKNHFHLSGCLSS